MKKIKDLFLLLLTVGIVNLACGCNNPTEPLSIEPPSPPKPERPEVTLQVSSDSIIAGKTVTLSWSSKNGTSCKGINFSTNNMLSGKIEVAPVKNTTYSVLVEGAGGSDTAMVTVSVKTEIGLGNYYLGGKIIWLDSTGNHGLVGALNDLTPVSSGGANFVEAKKLCADYGEGYRLPDSVEIIYLNNARKLHILSNFVDPKFDYRGGYYTSVEMKDNPTWIFAFMMYTGEKLWITRTSPLSVRAVRSF